MSSARGGLVCNAHARVLMINACAQQPWPCIAGCCAPRGGACISSLPAALSAPPRCSPRRQPEKPHWRLTWEKTRTQGGSRSRQAGLKRRGRSQGTRQVPPTTVIRLVANKIEQCMVVAGFAQACLGEWSFCAVQIEFEPERIVHSPNIRVQKEPRRHKPACLVWCNWG